MAKNKYIIVIICSLFILFVGAKKALGRDYAKSVKFEYIKNKLIEVTDSSVKEEKNLFGHSNKYLFVAISNRGDKDVVDLELEMICYINNKLIGTYKIPYRLIHCCEYLPPKFNRCSSYIPAKRERKCKIFLPSFVPKKYLSNIDHFEIKITDVFFPEPVGGG